MFEAQINAPRGKVLRHKVQLAHSLRQQRAGLVGDVVGSQRLESAPDGGDGAKSALVPAALAHLEPGVRRSGGKQPASPGDVHRRLGQAQRRRQHGRPARDVGGGQPHVHFGQFGCQLRSAITPHHAAANGQQRFDLALLEPLHGIHYRAYRFAHCGVNKPAGIDEYQASLAHVLHMLHGDAQRTEQALAVHPVFGAAKTQ